MLVGSTWVNIKGERNKSDITAGVCYSPLNQTENLDNLFIDQITKHLQMRVCVIMGDHHGISWKSNSVKTQKTVYNLVQVD